MLKSKLAEENGLTREEVRCYHCRKWGYNHGKVMNSTGDSYCPCQKKLTPSYGFCKHFDYVGGGKNV